MHAWGQVVSFDAPAEGLDLDAPRSAASTGWCGPAIVVRAAEAVAAPDFDARFSAGWRRYRYTVLNRPVPDPFLAAHDLARAPTRSTCHVLRAGLRPADRRARLLVVLPAPSEPARGAAPSPRSCGGCSDAGWDDLGDGRAALRDPGQRLLPPDGALDRRHCWSTSVGAGARPGDVLGVLRARDRPLAGQLAPPHGLCLWEVGY